MDLKVSLFYRKEASKYCFKTKWDEDRFQNICIYNKDLNRGLEESIEIIEKYILEISKEYIISHSRGDDFIRCPDVKITLPIDRWDCKNDNDYCGYGSEMNLTDYDEFNKNCRQNKEKKTGIWKAILNNNYNGFHHIPGRYLCPLCEKNNKSVKKINYTYHYPWELSSLPKVLDLDYMDRDFKIHLIRKKIPSFVSFCHLCTKCCGEILPKLEEFKNGWEIKELLIKY